VIARREFLIGSVLAMAFGQSTAQGFKNTGPIIANKIVVEGSSDGLFEYTGTGAFGNPPVAWVVPVGVTEDPYGNPLPLSGGFVSGSIVASPGNGALVQVLDGIVSYYYGNTTSGYALMGQVQGDSENGSGLLILSGAAGNTPAVIDPSLVAQEPGQPAGTPETWHAVTIPATWTGTARVKVLAESNFAVFDCNITAPGGGATSGSFGTFPSSAYYPLAEKIIAAGFTGAVAGTNARLIINPASTGPSFAGLPAGFTGSLQMTVTYPLD
jgi:hypothetical protein